MGSAEFWNNTGRNGTADQVFSSDRVSRIGVVQRTGWLRAVVCDWCRTIPPTTLSAPGATARPAEALADWSRGDANFPVEAAVVWLFAPFSSILTYEFAKALTHHPRTTKAALFGSLATRARTSI